MNGKFLAGAVLFLLVCGFAGQSPHVPLFLQKGFSYTQVYYDAAGKPYKSGSVHIDSTAVRNDTIIAYGTIDELRNDNGALHSGVEHFCAGNIVSIDLKTILGAEQLDNTGDVKQYSERLIYTLAVKPGDTLAEGGFLLKSTAKTGAIVIRATWSGRRCTGTDTVVIQGITYSTCIIESDLFVNTGMASRKVSGVKQQHKEWFSPEYGILRTEMYFKGKLQRSRRVTSIRLPSR